MLVFATGKTTLLRDVARLMSLPVSQGGLGMSVVVVDTSNEIAGETYTRGAGKVGKDNVERRSIKPGLDPKRVVYKPTRPIVVTLSHYMVRCRMKHSGKLVGTWQQQPTQ